jgi:hypothetical protein
LKTPAYAGVGDGIGVGETAAVGEPAAVGEADEAERLPPELTTISSPTAKTATSAIDPRATTIGVLLRRAGASA